MRYINDDITPKAGGRKAPSISKTDLEEKLIEYLCHLDSTIPRKSLVRDPLEICNYLFSLEDGKFVDDLRFDNSYENITCDPHSAFDENYGTPLLGYQTLENGFTFLGAEAGNDCGAPIFYVIYWDGKTIRCYIPVRGNEVNLDFKCALFTEEDAIFDADDEKKLEKLTKKYKAAGIWTESEYKTALPIPGLDDDTDWALSYLKKYGLDDETLMFHWKGIKEDIMTRIQVI